MTSIIVNKNEINSVRVFELDDKDVVVVCIDELSWHTEDMRIDIKVGNEKAKVKLSDIFKALKDAMDTGDFEMDEIDSAVWKIESKLEDTQEKLDSAMDLIESRGRI